MRLLVKYSFDINDHIISLFLRQCASWVEFCACLTPFISLTSSHKLTWLQFDLYTSNTMSVLLCLAGCACIVERTSDVAYSSMSLNSSVTWCSWWLHGGLSRAYLFCCASCLLLRYQACDFTTSDNSSSECDRISSHTKCSTISLDDCVRLLKSLVNNYWWELSARFVHNNISVQNAWAIWGCFC